MPSFAIIGPNGNSGKGAQEFLQDMGISESKISLLGRDKTQNPDGTWKGELTDKLKQHDIIINCIKVEVDKEPPILINKDYLESPGKTSVITDVSCDVGHKNIIAGICDVTSFKKPAMYVGSKQESH